MRAFGYAVVEDERPGRFDPQEARRLGVSPGPDFKRLQEAIPEGTSLFIDDIRVREHSASLRIFEKGVLDRCQLIVPPQVVLIAEDDDVCLALKNAALKVTQITHIASVTTDAHWYVSLC